MLKTIFFDFDGVLTTDPSAGFTICNNLHTLVPTMSVEEILKWYYSNNLPLMIGEKHFSDVWPSLCQFLGVRLDMGVLKDVFEKTPKNQAMFDLCEQLKPHYLLGIITDNSKERFTVLEKTMSLSNTFFTRIISADVGSGKHEEKIFDIALATAHAKPEESIFIDNSEKNLLVPAQMGFKTFWHDDKKNDITLLKQQLIAWGVQY